ncbi:MAG: 16S rRNA (cytosine(1402)-N(4))-methyltransferase RsmH [Ignavibacteriae bacterium]|nr:16S rRNA (cytosine(1402)-N(4))-methyltransferase RsmH [Ignavibacteria bacterium]MBI3364105.1 16S rRNA (cytosine(1402)-N(4))-methyltransferase RsmH [Ignavibacteriota bacterium]
MTDGYHTPVLRDEVLHYLQLIPDGTYVDGTLGGGGHAESIIKKLSVRGRLIAFDRDADAIRFAQQRLENFHEQIVFVQDNFSHIKKRLSDLDTQEVHGIVLDLGVSSFQIDQASRGFSFQRNSRLDMRMDRRQTLDAWTVINSYNQDKLVDIFWKYGEELNSRRIARVIVEKRKQKQIDTTHDLNAIVERVVGGEFLQKSLARIFQAIRIEVNRELESLESALCDAVDVLRPSGRLVVIAYHSLEDRIVKDFFKKESRKFLPSGSKYVPDQPAEPRLRILTKKPITVGEKETVQNTRARSAKLRAAERI